MAISLSKEPDVLNAQKNDQDFQQKMLLQWIVTQVLFVDNPNAAKIAEKFEMLSPIIPRFLHFSRLQSIEDLKLMDYPEHLAEETSTNVVGKVVAFFALFLARQDLEHWLPNDLTNMTAEEKAFAIPALLASLDSAIQLAKIAYYWDEHLDRPDAVDEAQAAGLHGYELTVFPDLIQAVESFLSDPLFADKEKTGIVSDDMAKLKLLQLVELYCNEFACPWNELQNDEYFQDKLKNEGLLALLPVVKHIAFLGSAYRTQDNKISEEGREVLRQAILPLADVFNFELTTKLAHDAIQNGNSSWKIHLPTDFKESLSLSHGESQYSSHEAFPALFISAAKGQGLMMVANTMYLLRRFDRYYNPEENEYQLALKPDRQFKNVKELLDVQKNKKLSSYIDVLQLLVRISDDIGDFEADKGKAGNVLSANSEGQQQISEMLHALDLSANTSLAELVRDIYEGIHTLGTISMPTDVDGGDVFSYWVERLEAEVNKAETALFTPDENGLDLDAEHQDYRSYVEDIRAIALGAIRIGTLANDAIFTRAMKLATTD